jgi:hypothetical protein
MQILVHNLCPFFFLLLLHFFFCWGIGTLMMLGSQSGSQPNISLSLSRSHISRDAEARHRPTLPIDFFSLSHCSGFIWYMLLVLAPYFETSEPRLLVMI